MTRTLVRSWVLPTEDPDKVSLAIRNIFGNMDLAYDGNASTFSGSLDGLEGLKSFRDKIAQDRIRDTLKRVFSRWRRGDELSFGLNRQAAYVGHVSLSLENEDPMGPIQVNISGEIDSVISYLCDKGN